MRIENPHVKVRLFVSSPQTPFADTSSLAPSCVLAVAPDSCSGVTGCRLGSMHTSLQASVRRFAVRSRISLCRKVGKPPLLQDRACSTVRVLSQSHFGGRLDGVHPYLRARASWKAALCSVNPWSLRGRTVSQVEAPFSLACTTVFCCRTVRWLKMSSASLVFCSLLFLLTSTFIWSWLAIVSYPYS